MFCRFCLLSQFPTFWSWELFLKNNPARSPASSTVACKSSPSCFGCWCPLPIHPLLLSQETSQTLCSPLHFSSPHSFVVLPTTQQSAPLLSVSSLFSWWQLSKQSFMACPFIYTFDCKQSKERINSEATVINTGSLRNRRKKCNFSLWFGLKASSKLYLRPIHALQRGWQQRKAECNILATVSITGHWRDLWSLVLSPNSVDLGCFSVGCRLRNPAMRSGLLRKVTKHVHNGSDLSMSLFPWV